MTAVQVIRQIKALPPKERAKVRRFVFADPVPNATTRKALADADAGRDLVRCRDLRQMLSDLKS